MIASEPSGRIHSGFGEKCALLLTACLIAISVAMTGCSSGGGSSPSSGSSGGSSSPSVTVTVSPSSANVLLGNTQQFNVTVSGSSNTGVTWSVNGVAGGNTTVGTITSGGLYTAPADLPNPASVTVTATSQASSAASGSSAVSVTSDIKVAVQVSSSSVSAGGSLQLQATITSSGHPDPSVTWSVDGVAGGNSADGTIVSTGADTATYTAPATVPTPNSVSIEAMSVADATQSFSAAVTIAAPPVSLTLTGTVAISPMGGATVTGYALNSDGTEGSVLGSTTSGADGSYSLTLTPAPTGPFLLVATGGSYTDEVTAAVVNLSASEQLTAAVPAGATQVAITVLTHMAATRARALAAASTPLATAVDSSNIGIEQQYQIADIVRTLPVTANSATALQSSTTAQRDYGLVLAGIMQEAQTLGVQAIDLADALATDASDGTLDGTNSGTPLTLPKIGGGSVTLSATAGTSDLQTAINSFVASTNNKTNVTVVDILGGPQQIGVNTTSNALFEPNTPVLPAYVTGTSGGSITLGATGGTPPYGCYLASGSTLPSWLGGISASASSPSFPCTLSVVGTVPAPSGGGPMEILPGPVTLVFTDSSQPPNTAQFSFFITIVEQPPTLTAGGSCGANQTCPFATASGGDSPYYYEDDLDLGAPPLGVFVNLDGSVTVGSSVAPGSYTFGVCVVDSFGAETCQAATLTVVQYNLTVTTAGTGSGTVAVSPVGTSCGSGCYAYAAGTTVQLTATPSSGSTFNGWSGACSGTGTCTVTMSQDQSVTATFGTSGGSSTTEVWVGTITGTATDSATGGVTSGCYASGAVGTWSFSYQVTLTVVSSLASALQTNGGGTSGTGTVSGSETVSTQLPSNPPDNCALLPSSVSNASLLVAVFGPTSTLPPQIQLEGPGGSSDCTSDVTFGTVCELWYYALQPTSVSATQITGVLASGGGYQGTFTLTKQ